LARPCPSLWIIGRTKAAVLPVPVWAMPVTSRPPSTAGIPCSWMGVGVVYPEAFTAARILGSRLSSSNVIRLGLRGLDRLGRERTGCVRHTGELAGAISLPHPKSIPQAVTYGL